MLDKTPTTQYSDAIRRQFESGQAREHAYRPALERLMHSFKDVTAVNDPRRSEHGNPDMAFLKESNTSIILGYAEAKDITVDLDKTLKTEQLRRYAGYANLYLTNYLDFVFLKNGDQYERISIGKIVNNELKFDYSQFSRLESELQDFVTQEPEVIKSGKRLSEIMGGKARRIRDRITFYLSQEDKKNGELDKVFRLMKESLVHDLSIPKFADMYSQTLVYGLFVARYNDKTPDSFSRAEARDLVPKSNPFLREFFDHIVGPRFDTRLANIVDELCAVFEVSNVKLIIQKHLKLFQDTNEKDPIIHFYEDFLKEYDPIERKKMGAYYTPIPVVQFMIQQVDSILKDDFGMIDGIADTSKKPVKIVSQGTTTKVNLHSVQILDPAVGTATFLNEIINYIYAKFQGQEGRWPTYVQNDLIPRLYGFELMMAPYTIAHLKLGMTLQDTGVEDFSRRLGVYLTNTLEEGQKKEIDLFAQFGLAEVVSAEANEASKIKHNRPIMVIIGNPPYSGESSNKTDFANSLVSKYKYEPGGTVKLNERNPKWLNDDYVKFIAFAEEMIMKNGEGVVALITGHGYLDNPTFRGMRWRLASSFDVIKIIDLHGNSNKQEASPDGTKDENVFDILQGVSIIFAIKTGKKRKNQLAKVKFDEVYGLRDTKFDWLRKNEPAYKDVELDPKMFYFANKNTLGKKKYESGVRLNELFITTSIGVVTGSDSTFVSYTEDEMTQKLIESTSESTRENVRKRMAEHSVDYSKIVPISYRPFDNRFIYFQPSVLERAREKVMKNFVDHENIGLVFRRQQIPERQTYYFITDKIMADGYIRSDNKGGETVAPLYNYHDDGSRTANFHPHELKRLAANLVKSYSEVEVIDYIYGVLYSNKYRDTYKAFLITDYPCIPIPKNDAVFEVVARFGKALREAHLQSHMSSLNFKTSYPEAGSNTVEITDYNEGSIWINSKQFFGNIPEAVWNIFIGGYNPAQKFLKDRKGRQLESEDIEQFQRLIASLTATIDIVHELDKVDFI